MKFIVDDMLGKLAKWLRILGYDTLYRSAITNEELLKQGALENRIVLTRDTGLVCRAPSGKLVLVRHDSIWEQLRQVISELNLDLREHFLTRCSVCNSRTISVDRASVEGKVPEYVFETEQEFSRCPQCGRIYWRGTHCREMMWRLDWIRGEQDE